MGGFLELPSGLAGDRVCVFLDMLKKSVKQENTLIWYSLFYLFQRSQFEEDGQSLSHVASTSSSMSGNSACAAMVALMPETVTNRSCEFLGADLTRVLQLLV